MHKLLPQSSCYHSTHVSQTSYLFSCLVVFTPHCRLAMFFCKLLTRYYEVHQLALKSILWFLDLFHQPYSDHRDVTVVKSQAILKLLHTSHKSQVIRLKSQVSRLKSQVSRLKCYVIRLGFQVIRLESQVFRFKYHIKSEEFIFTYISGLECQGSGDNQVSLNLMKC